MKNHISETATGGMMIGMISSDVKIARPRIPCASRSASPRPSRISTVVTVSAHFNVVTADCRTSGSPNARSKLSKPMNVRSIPPRWSLMWLKA